MSLLVDVIAFESLMEGAFLRNIILLLLRKL
jgi:hypothetical protein